jgi:ATP-GRASP peptide maturase of grasp-with-spasm system
MIVFFSDSFDVSSKKIIEWVISYKEEILILNEEGKHYIDLDTVVGSNIKVNINGTVIDSNSITAVYYRRSGKKSKLEPFLKKNLNLGLNESAILNFIVRNEFAKDEILTHCLNDKRVFGAEYKGRTNKLLALVAAKKMGLNTPETILTGSKKKLIAFHKNYSKMICKALDITFTHFDGRNRFIGYTNVIGSEVIEQLENEFPVTLFQEYLEKEFEIRCFWFHGNFYAIAIFSQNNPRTKIDYRRYDRNNPNRQVPFSFPEDLKDKINHLFQYLNLNTGSLDIIVSGDKYYFLEINPVGIFDNVSGWGNWYIEREIAKYLTQNDK